MANCSRIGCGIILDRTNESQVSKALGLSLCIEHFKDALWGNERAEVITRVAQLGEDGKLLNTQSPAGSSLTITDVKSDTDIADTISKKHSNSLDHASGSDNQDLSGKSDAGHTHNYEPANTNIQTHVTSPHAPSNAQKNSDITKDEIETKLTGQIATHTHVGGSGMNLLRTTSNQIINSGAGVFTDITGLTFPVVSGVDYAFHFYITFQSAATTTGWKSGVNCPTGTLDFWASSDVIANGAAGVATHTRRHNTVRNDMTQLIATITQAVDLAVEITGRYLCTQNGTFAARFANELGSNTQIVVQKGSWGYWF